MKLIIAYTLLAVGLLTIWYVFFRLGRRTWYHCPHCGRYQDERGEYGMPVDGDRDGGDNTCEICRRTLRDADLARRVSL